MTKPKQATRPRPRVGTSLAYVTSRGPSVFPAHLQSTPEAWRALKRQEWLEVTQALDRFRYGSAFAPAQQQLWTLGLLAEQISEALGGDWVAW